MTRRIPDQFDLFAEPEEVEHQSAAPTPEELRHMLHVTQVIQMIPSFDRVATMNNRSPRQLEFFSDGARAVAAAKRQKPLTLTEADLQAKLDAARIRLHEVVILSMKTWLPEETMNGLREAEARTRERVRVHHRILERFREEQRRHRQERHFTL
jgi:hypothetical protein